MGILNDIHPMTTAAALAAQIEALLAAFPRIEYRQFGCISFEGDQCPAFVIGCDEVCIYDPFVSQCGRFEVTPQQHGISAQEAEALIDLNTMIGVIARCQPAE